MNKGFILLLCLFSLLSIGVDWGDVFEPIGDMADNMVGDPIIIGIMIFLFFFMFALVLYIPFEGVVVIMMPTLYATFEYIPPLKIVVAIMVGILIGIGLLKWIRR